MVDAVEQMHTEFLIWWKITKKRHRSHTKTQNFRQML